MPWWQKQSLRFKTTFVAVALGVIPVVGVGLVLSGTVANNLREQIVAQEKQEIITVSQEIESYITDRYKDTQIFAQWVGTSAAWTNQNRSQLTSQLSQFQQIHPEYDSIAIFDNNGNPIAQTQGEALGNHLNRTYIQAAKAANGTIVSQPLISTSSGTFSIYFASVLKNSAGQTVGFIRSRLPVQKIQEEFVYRARISGSKKCLFG